MGLLPVEAKDQKYHLGDEVPYLKADVLCFEILKRVSVLSQGLVSVDLPFQGCASSLQD